MNIIVNITITYWYDCVWLGWVSLLFFVLLIIYKVRIVIDAKLIVVSLYISPKSSLVAEQL